MYHPLISFLILPFILPFYRSALENSPVSNSSKSENVITLADGNKFTGIDLHLPVPFMDPVRAYFGIRYSSLGPVSSTNPLSKIQTQLNFTQWHSAHVQFTSPAVSHRFSHSVASFFYEAPSGIQSKTVLPPVCPQSQQKFWHPDWDVPKWIRERLLRISPFLKQQTEDCLTLNIFVPRTELRRSYQSAIPVLLFVHGENYEVGTGNAYDLSVLASYSGAICITFNYRLGLFGFFSTSTDESSGNFALFDLYAAIMWIKTNVASFGGDPNEITLMGYGYGAALIHLFSISKMCQGIGGHGIKRIILLNGSGFAPWAISRQTQTLLNELAEKLNITMENDQAANVQNRSQTTSNQTTDVNNAKPYAIHSKANTQSLFASQSSSLSNRQNKAIHQHPNSMSSSPRSSLHDFASNQTANQTKSPKLTIQAKLFNLLKHLPTEFVIQLQQNLTRLAYASKLGPVIKPHLFPNHMVPQPDLPKARESHQPRQRLDQPARVQSEPEMNLFHKADLLIGFTEEPAIEFLYHTMHNKTDEMLLDDLVSQTYPYHRKAIKEILKYVYCGFEEKRYHEMMQNNSCRRQLLSLLSDGLYKAPLIQTLKLHTHFKDSMQTGSTYAFLFKHSSTTRSSLAKPQMNPLLRTSLTQSGFGDDLAYYLGAPLVSPNQLEPFPNNYVEQDRILARKFMTSLTNFIHYGDPNKEAMRQNNAKFPIHWPEYTLDKQFYLVVGQNYDPTQDHTQRSGTLNLWGQENKQPLHDREEEEVQEEEGDFLIRRNYEPEKMTLWSHLLPTLATYADEGVGPKSAGSGQAETGNYLSDNQHYFYFLQLQELKPEKPNWPNQTKFKQDNTSLDTKFVELCKQQAKEIQMYKDLIRETNRVREKVTEAVPTISPIRTTTPIPLVTRPAPLPYFVPEPKLWSYTHPSQTDSHQVSPSTRSALLWTIAVGSTLFVLNALVFVAVYYQANRLRCHDKMTSQNRSNKRNKPVTIIPGNTNVNYSNGIETSTDLDDPMKKRARQTSLSKKPGNYADDSNLKSGSYCINPLDNPNLLVQIQSGAEHECIRPLIDTQPDKPTYQKQNLPMSSLMQSQTLRMNKVVSQSSNKDWTVESPSVLRFPNESSQHQTRMFMGHNGTGQQSLDQTIKSYAPFH